MLSVKLAIIRKDELMLLSTLVPLYIPHLKLDWVIASFRRFKFFEHRFSVARKNSSYISQWDREMAKLELLLAEVKLTVQTMMDMRNKVSKVSDPKPCITYFIPHPYLPT